MRVSRMFELVALLAARGRLSAEELAAQLEVSVRTIYRDVQALSEAGVPVYATRGKYGGVQLMEGYLLDRGRFSAQEQQEILADVQGMRALRPSDAGALLDKLGALFCRAQPDWLEADFSPWGGAEEPGLFELLRGAILCGEKVSFTYYSALGERSERTVGPEKLVFKEHAWYLYAFCCKKRAPRLFRITRIRGARRTGEPFSEKLPPLCLPQNSRFAGQQIPVKLRIAPSQAYRVYDSFPPESVQRLPDGWFLVCTRYPPGDWVIGFLLSFGASAELLEPAWLRAELARRLEQTVQLYRSPREGPASG